MGEGLAAALHPEAPGRGSAGVARCAAFRDPPGARWERAGHELKRNRGRATQPGLASPHARRGRRNQSASDVSLPIPGPRRGAHTPGSPFADWLRVPPVGPEAGGGGPRPARPPALPAAPGLLPSLPCSLRLPCAPARPACLTPNGRPRAPISGRQGASPGLRRRIGGARGSGREAGLPRAAVEEQLARLQLASAERAARRVDLPGCF